MLSEYLGLIIGTTTRRVYALINPEYDYELDNPRHLLLQNDEREPVRLIKVERGGYEACMTPEDVETLINAWYVASSKVQEGEEHLDQV